MRLSPAQVASRLSVREFLQLSEVIDYKFGKKELCYSALHGTGGAYAIAERSKHVYFEIIGITQRGRARKEVTCLVNGETYKMYWSNLVNWPVTESPIPKYMEQAS